MQWKRVYKHMWHVWKHVLPREFKELLTLLWQKLCLSLRFTLLNMHMRNMYRVEYKSFQWTHDKIFIYCQAILSDHRCFTENLMFTKILCDLKVSTWTKFFSNSPYPSYRVQKCGHLPLALDRSLLSMTQSHVFTSPSR